MASNQRKGEKEKLSFKEVTAFSFDVTVSHFICMQLSFRVLFNSIYLHRI